MRQINIEDQYHILSLAVNINNNCCSWGIAFSLEAAICIVMALPLFLFLSGPGGYMFLVKNLDKAESNTSQNTMLETILLAPYLVTPFETQLPTYSVDRIVENQIRINAPANDVWENIVSIP